MIVRRLVFWLHLFTGLTAGAVILVMSVTGVLLTFAPQIVDYAERDLRTVAPPAVDASRVSLVKVVAAAQDVRGGEPAITVAFRSEPQSSIRVGFGREATLFMHPFTGAVVGPGSRTHDILHVVEDWHRWLGSRDLGRPFTGACNLAFLGLGISGLFLWWPRAWSRRAVRADHRARPALAREGARLQLAQQHRLLVRAGDHRDHADRGGDVLPVGERPPLSRDRQRAAPRRGRRRRGARHAQARPEGREKSGAAPSIDLDALATRAAGQVPGWVAITLRLPQRPGGPVTAFIQEPPTWHPNPRSVLTLDPATAQVVRWDPFAGANLGRKLRMLVRVSAHR